MLVVCCRRSVTLGPVGVQSLLCYVDVRCLLYAVGGLSHWVQWVQSLLCYVDVRCLLYAVGGLSHWVQLGSSHFSVMLMSGACCMLRSVTLGPGGLSHCRRSVTLGPVGVQSLLCYVDVRCLLYAVGGLSHWVQLGSSHFSVMLMSGACCML